MVSLADQVREAASALRGRPRVEPRVGIILGTGLGPLADVVDDPLVIPYAEIPHFAASSVPGHSGRLVSGTLEGVPVAVLRGRVHAYEGYTLRQVTLPVRVLRRLGAEVLIVTNAAGGINPDYAAGDLMVLRDHINLIGLAGLNPLIGPDEPELGERFLKMADAYDAGLRAEALRVGGALERRVHEGVYAVVAGPSFETGAEVRYLGLIGADAVGMSTVPEVIVARQERMRVLGVSVITNPAGISKAGAGAGAEADALHEDVLSVAELAGPDLRTLVRGVLRGLCNEGTEPGTVGTL